MAVHKNLKSTQFSILWSFFYNFAQKAILWVVLALVPILAVFGTGPDPGLGPDGPESPETLKTNPALHSQQLLIIQLCPEINSLGCPCSCPLLAIFGTGPGPGRGPDSPGSPETP